MVVNNLESPVSGIKLSSVVPAKVTGDDKAYELTNMDLAMKLHYIKGVYFFKSEAVQGLTIYDLKKPMFEWLQMYYSISGRIRRSETGRPYIKCNDSGVRVVEAFCDNTIDEWLAMNYDGSRDQCLVYNHVLGPDLGFSPLVFIQFTWFKCGGTSIGLSWAHVLGDAFSASTVINMLGQIMAGNMPSKPLNVPNLQKFPTPFPGKLLSMERVDPVCDYWLTTSNCKMGTHTFHVTAKQLDHMTSSAFGPIQATKISRFEILSAIIWKSLLKLREDSGLGIVTICTNNAGDRENQIPNNGMVLSIVEADFSMAKGDIAELATLIAEKRVVENGIIEEVMERDGENSDFIVYGANLTFVNLEESNIYGLELRGHKPVFANYAINGVGDQGVILVLPGPEKNGENARTLTIVLPEDQLSQLKNELKMEWDLV